MEMSSLNSTTQFGFQYPSRAQDPLLANGFKQSNNISLDAATRASSGGGEGIPANPYNMDQVSDEAWITFVKASKGFDETAVRQTQQLLFENKEYVNTMTDAFSLLDWSKRSDVIRENIILPESSSSNIPDTKKRMIADQMKMMVSSQVQILGNFSFLAQNGGQLSLNLVA